MILDEPLHCEQQHLQGFVEAFLARWKEQLILHAAVVDRWYFWESSARVKIVRVEDVTQMMCLDTDQVHNLTKGCIDLLLRHIHSLCSPEPKATDGSYFIHWVDGEHLVDESGLL